MIYLRVIAPAGNTAAFKKMLQRWQALAMRSGVGIIFDGRVFHRLEDVIEKEVSFKARLFQIRHVEVALAIVYWIVVSPLIVKIKAVVLFLLHKIINLNELRKYHDSDFSFIDIV